MDFDCDQATRSKMGAALPALRSVSAGNKRYLRTGASMARPRMASFIGSGSSARRTLANRETTMTDSAFVQRMNRPSHVESAFEKFAGQRADRERMVVPLAGRTRFTGRRLGDLPRIEF